MTPRGAAAWRGRGATVSGRPWRAVQRALLVAALQVLAGGTVWAQSPPEAVEYYARDAVGSVRIVFDAQGNVLGRSDYLPFGETWNQSGALPRQRFTGQARDGEAGLDDFNARAYQPLFGRFTRPDPVSGNVYAPQSWNAYAYVSNRPLVLGDPSGRTAEGFFQPPIPFFCSAENSFDACGGASAFWSDWTGGGGGFSFGDGHAWALSVGWEPGMPDDLGGGLIDFVQRAERALAAQSLQTLVTSEAVASASLELDVTTQQSMRVAAYAEMTGASQDQFAALLSTMINRAFLTGAPMSMVLNSGAYQTSRPPPGETEPGNLPWRQYSSGAVVSLALELAFASIVQSGVTTNATSFKTNDPSTTHLGTVVAAYPEASISSPGGTLYLWAPAPGYSIYIKGWPRRR